MRYLLSIAFALAVVPAWGQWWRNDSPQTLPQMPEELPTEIPSVALMLPLEGTTIDNDFTEFYRGALLGFEDLKSRGRSVDVTLYDTALSTNKVFSIISSPEFLATDLIIGPVYEDELEVAVHQFADYMSVPIVSPLATMRMLDSEMLYQMSPDSATRYDKLRSILGSGGFGQEEKNIVLVTSGPTDAEFEREIVTLLNGLNYSRFSFTGERLSPSRRDAGHLTESEKFAALIDWDRENIFVMLSGTEQVVDQVLATISSSYSNASSRSARKANIRVVGSSRWGSWNNIDKNLFFRLNATFVTSYYINRSDPAVAAFEHRYLTVYGSAPSRASYRGYDAVRIFVEALFKPGFSFADRLGYVTQTPLRVPYRFVQLPGSRRHVNTEWTLVEFSDDFNINYR